MLIWSRTGRTLTCTLAVTLPSRGMVADDMLTSETLKVV